MAVEKILNNPPPLQVVQKVNEIIDFGIVHEVGSNQVNMAYVRLACGLQFVWGALTTAENGYATQTFPVPFSELPQVVSSGYIGTGAAPYNVTVLTERTATAITVLTKVDVTPVSLGCSFFVSGVWK